MTGVETRRISAALESAGVRKGFWTLAGTIGSKLQTVVLVAVATRAEGIAGAGVMVLATSTVALSVAMTDLGLGAQINRLCANTTIQARSQIKAAVAKRTLLSAPVAGAFAWVTLHEHRPPAELVVWISMVALLTAATMMSSQVTMASYGFGALRRGASLNGWIRSATIPLLWTVHLTQSPLVLLLPVLAIGEICVGGLQYASLPKGNVPGTSAASNLTIRETWRFGVGAIANVVMNKSDTVLVSLLASPAALGVYAIASQLENALTTVAMVPSGAMVTFAATAPSEREASRRGYVTSTVVGVAYLATSIPFFAVPHRLVEIIFGANVENTFALRVCIVAGLFSCLAGVATQQLTGRGRKDALAVIWTSTALTAIGLLLATSATGNPSLIAIGALSRDVLFFTLAWSALRYTSRRN